jgi:alkanesulfonate monooxygenase SsuD/methylene tetrahydromethanopterin reductase-like flavin-dependent oxidoreductase (luciferase family)
MQTSRIRLGTLLSPISRMRPWKLASETATLDNLSGGRVILSVGLGATETGFESFGEVIDRRTRAELLDEGLDILTGLWRGQPFRYQGKHYAVTEATHYPPPPPVQQPRIPIWVVGAWPRPKSMERVARYDGLLPYVLGEDGNARATTPDDIRAMREFIATHRAQPTPFDVIMEGRTPGDNPAEAARIASGWADAGVTWWIEAMWDSMEGLEGRQAVLRRIEQGPPMIG